MREYAGDGHEDGLARAVAQMLGDKGARIGGRVGKNNSRNKRVNGFMSKMRSMSKPVDLEYPRDKRKADGGMRMRNINKVSSACTRLIKVKHC